MSKQDRQGVRTAAGLEIKHGFGRRFAEVLGVAHEAQEAAEQAQERFDGLTAEEIFNILTDNGKVQGLYRKDGQIYFNASYIVTGILLASLLKTGVIQSEDGSVELDLTSGKVVVYSEDKNACLELAAGEVKRYIKDADGNVICTLRIKPGDTNSAATHITNDSGPIVLSGEFPTIGGLKSYTSVDGGHISIHAYNSAGGSGNVSINADGTLEINGKTASWSDNGDGTFTLVGRSEG